MLPLLTAEFCKKGDRPGGTIRAVETKAVEKPAEILATGTIKPQVGAEVKVGPRISGRLDRLHVRVGDQVRKGQILAELDREELDSEVWRSAAVLAGAQARFGLAQAIFARRVELRRAGVVSRQDEDQARHDQEAAAAAVTQARAELARARVELRYAVVTAPISGTIASVSTQEGETVAASLTSPTFVTIIDLKRLQLEAYVDEVDIGAVSVGQATSFTLDAFPSRVFRGRVVAVNPQAIVRDNVVSYAVIVSITESYGDELRPEMTASVRLKLGSKAMGSVFPSNPPGHCWASPAARQTGRAEQHPVEAESPKARWTTRHFVPKPMRAPSGLAVSDSSEHRDS